ncbi:Hypothetical protein FKW44_000985 [Caligus rogercresseyi]|uniref:Uncharacterized protein n=1 Tax=Caligus rogercresseyi TaxID=217165 RepID=A0A7T8QVA1_CALRO|nr:Hypothetical protein FKW44_000985 [Caligus rogercresseyi]
MRTLHSAVLLAESRPSEPSGATSTTSSAARASTSTTSSAAATMPAPPYNPAWTPPSRINIPEHNEAVFYEVSNPRPTELNL